MASCTTNADCEERFYCDRVLMWCCSCRVICDPKRQMDLQCKVFCQEFYDEIHFVEQSATTNFVPLTANTQNLLATAETTSPRNKTSLIITLTLVMACIVIIGGCTVSRIIVYYKPNSCYGKGITRFKKIVVVKIFTLCLCCPEFMPETNPPVMNDMEHITVPILCEESHVRAIEKGTAKNRVESGNESETPTKQLTEVENENETNNETQHCERKVSRVNICPLKEVPNTTYQDNPPTGGDQQRMEHLPETQNLHDRVLQSNNATTDHQKTLRRSKDKPDSTSHIPRQGSKSSPNQSDSTVQLSSRANDNHTQNKRQESPLAAAADQPQFELDTFSTIPKLTGFSKEFKPTSQPVSLMDGGADLVEEIQQTPPEGQTVPTASSNGQSQKQSREHPNKKIYDVLKTIGWVQGYYSEGSSVEVFADLHHITREVALKELAMKTRSYPEKFHITHESGTY